jgi:hypothetical protein
MRVRLKPNECNAVQWTGDNLLEMGALAKGDLSPFRRQGPVLVVESPTGPEEARPGDWVIATDEGNLFTCDAETFPRCYETIGETPVLKLHH